MNFTRRDIIALLGGATAWPLPLRAQQPVPIVGFLSGQSRDRYARYLNAFLQGLKTAGFTEGRNVAIEYRWAEGRYDKLPALAAELVERGVAVIAATGTTAATLAAKAATTTIPIVFTSGEDPVKAGLVPNLNHPGGNVTGVSFLFGETGSKRLELLCEMVPGARSIGVLINPSNPKNEVQLADFRNAARALGRQLQIVNASNEQEIDGAFRTFKQQAVNAVVIGGDALFIARPDQIAALAARYALPAIYTIPEQAEVGGLMSYGASQTDAYGQAGNYVGRILKGEKPGDLPAMLATRFELVINLKSAKALGIEVPPGLSARADEVIE
jgi:putative ABC transport system substrate-binding protein